MTEEVPSFVKPIQFIIKLSRKVKKHQLMNLQNLMKRRKNIILAGREYQLSSLGYLYKLQFKL